MSETDQRVGGPVDQVEKRAPAGGEATGRSPEDSFLDLLANRATRQPDTEPVRTHGFVLVAHGTSSLQSLQRLCFDKRQSDNSCLTARYRLGPGAIFGTLLSMFAGDLLALGRAREDPGALGRLKGDLLPMGPDPLSTPWLTLLQHTDLMAVADELAGEDARANGIAPGSIDRFFELLGHERLLPVDYRLVLFCELPTELTYRTPPTGAPGPNPSSRLTREWQAARPIVLDRLPERMGLALGVPDSVTPALLPRDELHQRLIALEARDLEPADVVQRFKPAGLASDRPAWRDHLGRAPFAAAIARLILHPQTEPLTMGIEAPWGKGKSSFLNLISRALTLTACDHIDPSLGNGLRLAEEELATVERQRLDLAAGPPEEPEADRQARELQAQAVDQARGRLLQQQQDLWRKREHRARSEVVQVRFNAWRHQDATHIWAGLVSEVSKEVEASLPRLARILAPLRHALRQRTAELLVGVVVPTVLATLVGLVLYFLGGQGEGGDAPDEVPALLRLLLPGFGVLALLIWRAYKVVQPVSERMIDYVRLPDYRAQLGFQTQVLADLAFLRGLLKRPRLRRVRGRLHRASEDPKIVVFIDDLDRCSDATVMEVLQTINLILGESGLFVLLAVDTDKIHRAIANHYGSEGAAAADPSSFASSYLRKIVQLSFYLPQSDPQQRLDLVGEQFSPMARRGSGPSQERRSPGPDGSGEAAGEPARLLVDPDTVMSPQVVAISEVEDTPQELETFLALKHFTPDNPRELKRILNTHRFVKILLQRPETPPTEELQRKLVVWLVFCSAWPRLVKPLLDLAARSATTSPGQNCLHELRNQGGLAAAGDDLAAFQQTVDREKLTLRAADLEQGSFLARAAASSELLRVDATAAKPPELPPVTPTGQPA